MRSNERSGSPHSQNTAWNPVIAIGASWLEISNHADTISVPHPSAQVRTRLATSLAMLVLTSKATSDDICISLVPGVGQGDGWMCKHLSTTLEGCI